MTSPALPHGGGKCQMGYSGKWVYSRLPPTWTGSSTIGFVQPRFFLLPNSQGGQLGDPLFETVGTRTKRSLSIEVERR
jgi:hypothetical protein